MSTFQNRIKEFIEYKGISISSFERQLGFSNGLIGKVLKGSSLGSDKIEKILYAYKELNAHWLLTGKGKMVFDDNTQSLEYYISIIKSKDEIIRSKDEIIILLKEKIENLKKSNKSSENSDFRQTA
jgi:transcriptional regulator with XRE-family HTH domain